MTIVASNSLTLSKVNDGTITHTAWSYSADGNDRFTTVYPNLNLGDNTKTFAGADGVASSITGSIRIDPATQKTQDGDFYYLTSKALVDNYDWFRFFLIPDTATPNMTKVVVKPNTKYTFSVLLKGTGTHTIYAWQNWTAPNTPWYLSINLTSDWKLYTFTVTSKDVIPTSNVQFFIRSNNGTEINLKYPKVEEGSIATPYMQSASEVTTADWPKYIGHYTDFMQADSTNPSDYTWGPMRGNDGVGIKTTDITYAISTSGTTAPTTGWTSSVPSLVKGQYLWTKTVWTYTDNSSNIGYSVSYTSKDGNNGTDGTSGVIVSSVAPTSQQTGQLWQDTSTTPQLVKKWTGSSWVIWELYAQNLKADTLETISAKIGKIYNEFSTSTGGIDSNGTITIEDSVKVVYYLGNSSTTIDLVTSSSGQGLFTQYLPDKTDASKFKQSWYMPTGLYFTDSINNWNGQITAENVTLVPWKNLILQSGYTTGDGVQPQYRRIKNLDGSYTVQFRGAISPTSGNFPTGQVHVAVVSGVYTPPNTSIRQSSDDTGKGARVAITMVGNIHILAPNNSSYVYLDALTYVN